MDGAMIRIAFDIGGTFTDFVLEDGSTGILHFGIIPKSSKEALACPSRVAHASNCKRMPPAGASSGAGRAGVTGTGIGPDWALVRGRKLRTREARLRGEKCHVEPSLQSVQQ
jgi:hypothetical protein